MYIRPFCINQPRYAVFMQNIYGSYTEHSRLHRLTHTVLSPYTYGSFGLHIYMCRLTRQDVFVKTTFYAFSHTLFFWNICPYLCIALSDR